MNLTKSDVQRKYHYAVKVTHLRNPFGHPLTRGDVTGGTQSSSESAGVNTLSTFAQPSVA